jgi:hypothetical protein
MPFRPGIRRPSKHEISEIDRLRELAREAADILRQYPRPDTFLGRKTQEPFPV